MATGLLSKAGRWVKNNSSTILTFVAAGGFVATVITAVTATPKALTLIEEAKAEKGEDLTKVETVKAAAKAYIPSAILGVSTLVCIFSANILNQKKQAAITGAYALLQNSYKQYKGKVTELFGSDAEGQIKSEIAKDKYEKSPIERKDLDKKLFYDSITEQYFESDDRWVISAEYELNRTISTEGSATVEYWCKLLGIPCKNQNDQYIGWNSDSALERYDYCWVDFGHKDVTMDDGLEATVIYSMIEPSLEYMDDYIDVPDEVTAEYEKSIEEIIARI